MFRVAAPDQETELNRRTAILSLAAGLAACGKGRGPSGPGKAKPLDSRRLDKGFPALAGRANPAAFDAGVLDPANGQSWFWNAEKTFPMESFFMLPLAAAALAEVDAGRLKLGERIPLAEMDLSPPYSAIDQNWPTPPDRHATTMPAIDLISLAVQASDNTAADVLMHRIGGPGAVTAWLRQEGITDMRVDRYAREIEQDIAGMEPFRPQWKDEAAWITARDTIPAPTREEAMNAYLADARDTTTLRAAVSLLLRLSIGELLSVKSAQLLLTLMGSSRTGANRFSAGLPDGTTLTQKAGATRTDLGLTPVAYDAAIVTFKNGRRVIMAAFLSGSTATQPVRDRLFADSARLITQALG